MFLGIPTRLSNSQITATRWNEMPAGPWQNRYGLTKQFWIPAIHWGALWLCNLRLCTSWIVLVLYLQNPTKCLLIFINICCCCVSNGAVPDLISALTTWDPLEIFVVCRWATWPWGPGLMWRTAMARKTHMDIMDFLFDGWAFPVLEILNVLRRIQKAAARHPCHVHLCRSWSGFALAKQGNTPCGADLGISNWCGGLEQTRR